MIKDPLLLSFHPTLFPHNPPSSVLIYWNMATTMKINMIPQSIRCWFPGRTRRMPHLYWIICSRNMTRPFGQTSEVGLDFTDEFKACVIAYKLEFLGVRCSWFTDLHWSRPWFWKWKTGLLSIVLKLTMSCNYACKIIKGFTILCVYWKMLVGRLGCNL